MKRRALKNFLSMAKTIRAILPLGLLVLSAASGFAQITGRWEVSATSPAGDDVSVVELREKDGAVEGTYSGALGRDKAVSGTYKDKKITLSFKGDWPDGGPVQVNFSGEISENAGSGAVEAVGRTKGTWTARRLPAKEASLRSGPARAGSVARR
jgi:hypothetical protein